jgi:hypothetical protein
VKGLLPVALIWFIVAPNCLGSVESARPSVVVYCPEAPGYGQALKTLIEEDGRFDATVRLCESLQDFDVTMFFPDVKVAVVALSTDINQDLNQTLQWFFSQGGGLVGLGFAGSRSASGNASENVFPLFGTGYRSMRYDPESRKVMMSLIKEEVDEISAGLPSFSTPSQKIVLSFNGTANSYQPMAPEEGDYKVLCREETTGAPAVVKYRNEGVSVTFAMFGGDDFERGRSYYRLFIDEPEFKTLFTNSLYWVWNAEGKFEESVQKASALVEQEGEQLEEVRAQAQAQARRAKNAALMRSVGAVGGAVVSCAIVFWISFVRETSDRP